MQAVVKSGHTTLLYQRAAPPSFGTPPTIFNYFQKYY